MAYQGHLHAERFTACSFSIAQDYAQDYLRSAKLGSERAIVEIGPLHRPVRFHMNVRVDTAEIGRMHEEIVLEWIAGTRWLPNFSGTLRLRAFMPGTMLVLDGCYVPPGGPFGAIFDRVGGRFAARMTARALLRRIGEALAAREVAWRAAVLRSGPQLVEPAAAVASVGVPGA